MFAVLILAAAAPQAVAVKPVCRTTPPTLIRQSQRGRARPLSSEPQAQQYYTVLRTEDGCQKPVLVSERRSGHKPR